MTTEQILENNRLIAEFMGWKKSHYPNLPDKMYNLDKDGEEMGCHISQFSYHNSWNWLIPVVEKIESLGYVVKIHLKSCFIMSHDKFIANIGNYISKFHSKASKIDAVYAACVSFIQWFNTQNK